MRILNDEEIGHVSGGESRYQTMWNNYLDGFSDRPFGENALDFLFLIGLAPTPYY